MSKVVNQAEQQLREALTQAAGRAVAADELPAEPMPAFTVEIPGDRAHGDLAANAAMVSARSTHAPVPQWRQAYKEIYPIYADIYGRIKPLNDRIANLKIGD